MVKYIKCSAKEYALTNQVLRSGTAVGALIREAEFAQSPSDFINKLSIALKECNETFYWLNLLRDTEFITDKEAESILQDCNELLAILVRGKFLAFADDPLFDSFKENVERRIEPFLSSEIENRFLAKEYGKVAEIAEMLFRIDPANEIAIAMLVKALVKQRRHEDARLRYRSFCEVWQSVYDADYPVPFDVLCADARTSRK